MKPSSQFLLATNATTSAQNGGGSPVAPDSPKKMYHDFALVPEDVSLSDPSQTIAAIHGTTGKFDKLSFPLKLHLMLERLEFEGLSNIVGWETAHGRCFKVYDLKRFVAEILPRFFRHSKYASFQRQLNLYGFERITYGLDKEAYYNERFLRWRPKLASTIRRIKFKGTGPRRPANPQAEPNFYAMPPVLPPSKTSNQQQQQDSPSFNNNKFVGGMRNLQGGLVAAPQQGMVLASPSPARSSGTFGPGNGQPSSAVDLGGATFTTQAVGGGFMQYLMVPMMNSNVQRMAQSGASPPMPQSLLSSFSPASFPSSSSMTTQNNAPSKQASSSAASQQQQQLSATVSRSPGPSSGNDNGYEEEEEVSDVANSALQLLDDELLNSVCGGMNGNLGLDDFYFQQTGQYYTGPPTNAAP